MTPPSKCTPPAAILEPCAVPSVHTETTGDLIQAIVAYHEALMLCASKVDALRTYHHAIDSPDNP